MKKEHFEILLEKIDSNVEFLVESIDGINGRLDRAESERVKLFQGQESTHLRLRVLEEGQAKLEHGQAKLEQGQAKLEQGQAKLEQGQAKLEQGQAKLEQGQAKLEQGQARLEARQSKLELRQAGVERGLVEVRDELRGTRHTVGLLHTIANAHETRLLDVENTLRDHLDGHG